MRRPEEVFVFVRRRGDFLVLHRSPRKGAYWHGVAGGVETGESRPEAAARELREETGLVAEPVAVGTPYAYPVAEEPERAAGLPPGTEEIVVQSFVVDALPGWEPQLDSEHDDYRWCSPPGACELFRWPEPAAVLRELVAVGRSEPAGN